ncbi:MAG: PVC-type heme-binding CxxCH protein [Planctomycetaceae bacterium]
MNFRRFVRWILVPVLAMLPARPARSQAVPLVAPTEALSPAEQQVKFHLPAGFEIQLVASEPEIRKPINMNFDAAGRLYVTCSVEYPFPAKEDTPRDTIKVIADTNGDGVPDKTSTFADGLNIPIGVLPLSERVVLGFSIPQIHRFEDVDGDGRADRRNMLYGSFGSDDTHGLANSFNWGLDGWVYACHGFRNTSNVAGSDRQAVTMQSGNTYRFRTNGSHIEFHTHGQVNPFGMAFDELGNQYTADCHSRPLYMLLRGAYYPSFGKPDDGMGFGPEMIRHTHGSTGICGVVYYAADDFPAEYKGTVFIGNPVTGKINHDRLAAQGSTYDAVEQPDFVSCDDLWFRPVDLKLAPDGSLYIADFYNCIIGHYEVDLHHPRRDRERGRIWRVVYKGDKLSRHAPGPDLARASAEQLVAALDSPNLVQRTSATHQLAERVGETGVPLVTQALSSGSPRQKAHALYVLARQGRLSGEQIEAAARDADRLVRVHVARVVAGMNWRLLATDVRRLLFEFLRDPDATVRRAAADTLGQQPDRSNIGPLLDLWVAAPADDTHLVHMARLSLRDTLAAQESLGSVAEEYAARPALFQRLAEVSPGVHSAASAQFALAYLTSPAFDGRHLAALVAHVARHLPSESLGAFFSSLTAFQSGRDELQQAQLLRALHRSLQGRGAAPSEPIREWQEALALRLLGGPDESWLRAGIDLASDLKLAAAATRIESLTTAVAPHAALRQPAVEALVAIDPARAAPILSQFAENGDQPLGVRFRCAELLGNINSEASRAELLRLLRTVPDRVGLAVARGLANSHEGAQALLAGVADGKAAARLLQDIVVTERLKSARIPDLASQLEVLLSDLPSEDDRLKQLLTDRREGFLMAGRAAGPGAEVFQKICANCHRVAGKGAKIGPDLDGIGARGLDRLLEDVLLPSRNVDQAFRTTTIALKDGRTTSGLLLREEGEILVLVNETGQELRVPRADVDEQRVLKLSPMPANIAEQLGDDDFYRLIAYLLSLKGGNVGQPTGP